MIKSPIFTHDSSVPISLIVSIFYKVVKTFSIYYIQHVPLYNFAILYCPYWCPIEYHLIFIRKAVVWDLFRLIFVFLKISQLYDPFQFFFAASLLRN
jgi:hypothetical protein